MLCRTRMMRDPHALLALAMLALTVACSSSRSPGGVADARYDAKTVPVDSGNVLPGHVDVLTQHNDPGRTGQNLKETVLTQSNVAVGTFGKLMSLPVDGQIYAQPLIVTDTMINGVSHDALIVATMHNSVYAFDANTGETLWWTKPLGPSVPSSQMGPINPSTGKPVGGVNITVEVGITATPVIDRVHGYIYLTRKDYTNSKQTYLTHVLNLATGQDMPGSPVVIAASVPGPDGYDGGPATKFDATWQLQRPGLLLLNGTVYMAFASHQDWSPYHGWVLGYTYSASSGAYAQTQVFNVTPDGTEGGIWMGGQGLLSDGTSIYAMTSNGSVTVPTGGKSYGEAFLKLSPDLEVQDWFIPVEWQIMNEHDFDLGSGGPVLIPGTVPQLIVGGGKVGKLYVIDTSSLGHIGTVDDMNTQEFFVNEAGLGSELGNGFNGLSNLYGAPALWSGNGAPRLFVWPTADVLKAYDLKDGLFNPTPLTGPVANIQSNTDDPVGTLSVTSNGTTPGTGIVWAARPLHDPDHVVVPGTFYAFNAETLVELWDSTQNAARDGMNYFAKFNAPTVANGRVYLASAGTAGDATAQSAILVYGLLPSATDAGNDATILPHDAAVDATAVPPDAASDAVVAHSDASDAHVDSPAPFTLEAGITWHSLYRDYFGTGGRATCSKQGYCHGSTAEQGYQQSLYLCPGGDAGSDCYMGITSMGADLITPDASFAHDDLSAVLCQDDASAGEMPTGGSLAQGCAYSFSDVDLQRIAGWIEAGAQNN